jgi:acetolactate synthase-1/2/3 large subunit
VWSLETGFHENNIARIQMRHQQAAAYAADAYARCLRTPGVCFGSAGTGVTDSVSGINQSWLAGSPVIGLFGMHEWDQSRRGAFQEVYPSRIFDTMTKWCIDIDDRRLIPLYLRRALRDCMLSPPGPIVMGLTLKALGMIRDRSSLIGDIPRELMASPAPAQGDVRAVERAAKLLLGAQRPVIVVGDGAYWSSAQDELKQLVETLQIPVSMRRMARGAIPEGHPLAVSGSYRADFWTDADVLLIVGLKLGWFERNGRPPAWPGKAKRIVIQEAADEGWAPLPVDECIIGNPKLVLGQMLDLIRGTGHRPSRSAWLERLTAHRRAYESALSDDEARYADRCPVHPWNLSQQLADVLDPMTTVILDSFLVSTFLTDKIQASFPGQILDSGEGGGFGYGIGMGIGAQLARPGKPVLVLTSDTSIGIGGGDIETALRYRLPIVYLVCNQGSLAGGVDCFFQGQIQSWDYLPGLRYDRMYEVLGCHREYVDKAADVGPALRRAFNSGRTAVVQVDVDSRVVQPWFESLSFRLGVIAHQLDVDRIPEPFRTYLLEGRTPEVEEALEACGVPRSKTKKRVMAYDRTTCLSWGGDDQASEQTSTG